MNNKRLLLVTTALEQTWGGNESIVFLGEWCRLYGRRDVYSQRNYHVVRNHWDNRAKLRRDLDYLYALHESFIEHLTQTLNRYHRMERPIRYWRMVLGPWLFSYLTAIFDRWECLRAGFETFGDMETVMLSQPDALSPPLDYTGFVKQAAYSDLWNYQMFLRIIGFAYSDKCSIKKLENIHFQHNLLNDNSESATPTITSRFIKNLLLKVARILDSSLGALFKKYEVTFYTSYFPLPALIKLSIALGQTPRLYLREFEWPTPLKNLTNGTKSMPDRTLLTVARLPDSNFEAFLTEQIIRDLPYAYVEGFPSLLEKTRNIHISTKAICVANAHWHNELFKTWSAEQVLKGTKFIIIEHGGGIPSAYETLQFEEKVVDKKATSIKPYYVNHVQLPSSKLASRTFKSKKKYCSVIGNEMPRYCITALGVPTSGQVLEGFRMINLLYAGLNPELQDKFRVKPYANLGWDTRQRFIDELGAEKVYSEANYYRVLAQTRVVVCTYPQTTFSEAMASGLPTLLCYPAHLWETNPEMNSLLEVLRAANIIFHDPRAAAEHLNRIWSDPDKWWECEAVVHARKEFFKYCLDIDKNWLKRWTSFLKEMIR